MWLPSAPFLRRLVITPQNLGCQCPLTCTAPVVLPHIAHPSNRQSFWGYSPLGVYACICIRTCSHHAANVRPLNVDMWLGQLLFTNIHALSPNLFNTLSCTNSVHSWCTFTHCYCVAWNPPGFHMINAILTHLEWGYQENKNNAILLWFWAPPMCDLMKCIEQMILHDYVRMRLCHQNWGSWSKKSITTQFSYGNYG